LGLIDKINAVICIKPNNSIALEDLKAMNKKFAFTVGQKGLRKMAQTEVYKITDVTTVTASF